MANIIRNCEENKLKIFKGFHKDHSEYEYLQVDQNIEFMKDRKRIIGICLKNFFQKNELLSYYAEDAIKKYLTKNKINFMNTGLFFEARDESKSISFDIDSQRPDFLINSKNFGSTFLDVKARRSLKKKLKDLEIDYFYLNEDEILSLKTVQDKMAIPVWLIIKDINDFDEEAKKYRHQKFYFTTLSAIYNYYSILKRKFTKHKMNVFSYRIPISILYETNSLDKIEFQKTLPGKLIDNMVELTKLAILEAEEIIKNYIREEKVFKSYLAHNLVFGSKEHSKFGSALPNFSVQDINSILWNLIDRGVVKYEKEKFLTLAKEK